MSIKKVEYTEVKCNRCGAIGKQFAKGPFFSQGLHGTFEYWGRSFGGDVGGTNIRYDFCQDCTGEFHQWLKEGKQSYERS